MVDHEEGGGGGEYSETDTRVLAVKETLDIEKTWSQNGKRKRLLCLTRWHEICKKAHSSPLYQYPQIANLQECRDYREGELRKALAFLKRKNKKEKH